MIELLDAAKLPVMSFTSGTGTAAQGARADEVEAFIGHWVLNCGLPCFVPESGQKGFDLRSVKLIQAKHRSTKRARGGGWVVDNLRPEVFQQGLVETIILIETLAPKHTLNRILMVDAAHVYGTKLLYSEYNKRHQLSYGAFEKVCNRFGRILTLNREQ